MLGMRILQDTGIMIDRQIAAINSKSGKNLVEALSRKLEEVTAEKDDLVEDLNDLHEQVLNLEPMAELATRTSNAILEPMQEVLAAKATPENAKNVYYQYFWSIDLAEGENGHYWNTKTPFLLEACRELLGTTPVYELFPVEDNLHWFEEEYDEILWRERNAFGTIVDSVFFGSCELCKYEIDEMSEKYQQYQQQLYRKALELMVEKEQLAMLAAAPGFFIGKKK